jgi:hypothetical protein
VKSQPKLPGRGVETLDQAVPFQWSVTPLKPFSSLPFPRVPPTDQQSHESTQVEPIRSASVGSGLFKSVQSCCVVALVVVAGAAAGDAVAADAAAADAAAADTAAAPGATSTADVTTRPPRATTNATEAALMMGRELSRAGEGSHLNLDVCRDL